jgi:hypothetical protein
LDQDRRIRRAHNGEGEPNNCKLCDEYHSE